jgi:DNA-3-methyladenine glycosylase II
MTATTARSTLTRHLEVLGPFDLARTAAFSFGPKDLMAFDGAYRMAFVLDGYASSVGVVVRQPSPDRLALELHGVDEEQAEVATAQTARILSVDVDARGFVTMAEQDDLLAPLVAAAPGLRPPQFVSAYEALAWAVLSARRPRAQMKVLQNRLAEAAGQPFELAGERLWAFPTPAALLELDGLPGLPEVKLHRLHGVAQAALDGRLDTGTLRAMPVEQSAELARRLDGIGPFYAELMTVRTLGHCDALPTQEPRVLARLGELTGRDGPLSPEEFVSLAERWRPWRTWACVHVRAVDVSRESGSA